MLLCVPSRLFAAALLSLHANAWCTWQAAQALENAVDGLGSDGESPTSAAVNMPRKRKGKPFPEVNIPPRMGMKNVSRILARCMPATTLMCCATSARSVNAG